MGHDAGVHSVVGACGDQGDFTAAAFFAGGAENCDCSWEGVIFESLGDGNSAGDR
jgi:hypothetical protein